MKGNRVLIGLCALVLLVGFTAVASAGQGGARHSEQIIFSGTGLGTFNDTQSAFGFWIWCQDADSSTPYFGECNGAMYFYALGITKGVEGEVEESETSSGVYTMTVSSRNGSSVSCQLTNEIPIASGPSNTVDVTCTTPSGSGQSTNAVVNVTGPED